MSTNSYFVKQKFVKMFFITEKKNTFKQEKGDNEILKKTYFIEENEKLRL